MDSGPKSFRTQINFDYTITEKALMKAPSDIFEERMDIGSSDHYLVWFELGRTSDRNRKKTNHILYKWQVDRLQDKAIRIDYQAELGLHANDFFQTPGDFASENICWRGVSS